jgi:hypothetical protein
MNPLPLLQALAASLKPKAELTKASRELNPVWVLEVRFEYDYRVPNEKVLKDLGELEAFVERRMGNEYLRIAIPR